MPLLVCSCSASMVKGLHSRIPQSSPPNKEASPPPRGSIMVANLKQGSEQ